MNMKKSLIVAILLSAFMYTEAMADSILGRDVDNQDPQNTMVSLFARYTPTTVALGDVDFEKEEEHDAQVLDIGIYYSFALYTRLYLGANAYLKVAKIDDTLYGDSENTVYGGGIGGGLIHKTFFGLNKSYDLGLNFGLDVMGDIDLTDKNGRIDNALDYGLGGFYLEPTIGITYDPFGILIGYKFLTNFAGKNAMPTIALKYIF